MSRYEDAQRAALKGRKIADVQFVDGFPVLVLDTGVCVVIQRDAEGNGPGAITFQDAGGQAIDIWKGAGR